MREILANTIKELKMKEKFLDNLNAILCAFVGFTTVILLGCPQVTILTVNVFTGRSYQAGIDGFHLFGFSRYFSNAANAGALAAAGVFNIFVLIGALALLAAGVFTLLKKAGIFDWELDKMIGNFDTVIKILCPVLLCSRFYRSSAFWRLPRRLLCIMRAAALSPFSCSERRLAPLCGCCPLF